MEPIYWETVVTQLVEKSPYLVEPEGSLPYSQKPACTPFMFLVYKFTPYLFKIHFSIIFTSTSSLLSGLFPSGFPTKMFVYLTALILIHLITVIFGE